VIREVVLKDEAPFTPLLIERARGETQLFVKEVKPNLDSVFEERVCFQWDRAPA
jgi:hypothetical protein